MKTATIYLSGPMRGLPDLNFPEFDRAAKRLRGWGFIVINPAEMDREKPIAEGDLDVAIDRDFAALRGLDPKLDFVCLLSGWEKSKGAQAEAAYARFREVLCLLPEIWDREDGNLRIATVRGVNGEWTPRQDGRPIPEPAIPQADGAEEPPYDPPEESICYSRIFDPEKFEEIQPVRTFETGATRNPDTDKLDFEGFLSPLVLRRYAEYMHENRIQADGSVRASDNWQKGIPYDSYMKSLFRHFMEVWEIHRQTKDGWGDPDSGKLERALCAVMFNAMGYLHEHLTAEGAAEEDDLDLE